MTYPSIPPPATRAMLMLRFPPKVIFLKINRINNIITWKRRRCAGPRLLDMSPFSKNSPLLTDEKEQSPSGRPFLPPYDAPRLRSSLPFFPRGDDRASGAALGEAFLGLFPGDEHPTEMAGKGSYVPPQYIPLSGLDTEEDRVPAVQENHAARPNKLSRDPTQWSSGICACFDDPQSCCIGATCPCFLFGKNAQFLGSGTFAGSCTTHCMLWGLLTSLCCVFTGGLVLAVPGSAVACYACGYRSALRTKYNLPEAPCGDLTTHLFCHLCAICQEYREIRERTGSSSSSAPSVTPPPVQTMDDL